MIDKNKLYLQTPQVIKDKSGLVTILTDINGNEFDADKYKDGFEIIIDYPYEKGKPDKIIDYEVAVDDFERKYWKEIRKRQWILDKEHCFGGKWAEGWDE